MKKYLKNIIIFSFLISALSVQAEEKYPKLNANLEYGFLGVLDHKIQFSQNNTYFDYVKDGGQRVLFPVAKLTANLEFNKEHSIVFLYQPLGIETQNTLEKDIMQDNVNFSKGTPMRFLYDFPFFRASYLYDFNKDHFDELALGLSLQIRNANIEFESLDGSKLVSKKNIGPVPAIKFRSRNKLGESFWFGSEIDGFYAPIKYLNGSNNDVVGAILDANFKLGANLSEKYYPYINLRYIGGGGVGTSSEKYNLGDGYSNNWLHFMLVTLGMNISLN